jgi:Ser/Thr protein kinase RdoA (MazF antagonist)
MSRLTPSRGFRKLQLLDTLEAFVSKESKQHIASYFNEKDPFRKDREPDVLNWFSKQIENLSMHFKELKNHDENQLVHGDFNLGNFLVIDGSLEKIFDFDEMILAPNLYEVGIAIYYLDYDRPMYLDRLIGTFLKGYFKTDSIEEKDIIKVLYYMKYRAFYRYARYFTYYQYNDRPGEHFTKFQRIYEEIDALDPIELATIINSERLIKRCL